MITIIIPDLHGDFTEFCNILYKYDILDDMSPSYVANIMLNNSYENILHMENKQIIQLGDILDSRDRQPNSQYTIDYSDMLLFTFICKMKRAFKNQIILICGNHELMNCRNICDYASDKFPRTVGEIEYITKNVNEIFQFHYIDENRNLYIHSCIPVDAVSVNDLDIINSYIKSNLLTMSSEEFSRMYNYLFARSYGTFSQLSKLGVNRAFFGHTPHEHVKIVDNSIFYVDTMISRSFSSMSNVYECIHLNDDNSVSIDLIDRYIKYDI